MIHSSGQGFVSSGASYEQVRRKPCDVLVEAGVGAFVWGRRVRELEHDRERLLREGGCVGESPCSSFGDKVTRR